MTEALVVLAAAGAAFYVLLPILRRADDTLEHPSASMNAVADKQRALDALLDLDEDEAAGKLTAQDAALLRPRIERDAMDAVHAADVVPFDGEDPIEAEIAAAARSLRCASCGRVGGTPSCPHCAPQQG